MMGSGGDDELEVHGSAQELISEIKKTTASSHNAFTEELKHFRPVEEANWPLPKGYRARLAPVFFAWIFAHFKSGREFADDFISKHGLSECFAAQEIVRIMEHFDRLLTVDREHGWINSPSTEYLARRVFGVTEAFRDCRVKADWLKQSTKGWNSKVNWRRCDRIDPRVAEQREGPRMPEVDAELRDMEKDEIARLQVQQKIDEVERLHSGGRDPLNP